MYHIFDVETAKEYGVDKAVVIHCFQFWIKHNAANNVNFQEGKYWTYNSCSALEKIFPYWNKKQIWRIIADLEDKGILISKTLNRSFNKTKWYAFVDDAKWVGTKEEYAYPKNGTSGFQNVADGINYPVQKTENAFTQSGTSFKNNILTDNVKNKKNKKADNKGMPGNPGPGGDSSQGNGNGPGPHAPPVAPPPPKTLKGLYTKMVEIYFKWYKELTTVDPVWDGDEGALQGRAMKGLIEYFIRQIYGKMREQQYDYVPPDDELTKLVIGTWELILKSLKEKKVEPFLCNATKVNQILSNLQNIINQMKNGSGKQTIIHKNDPGKYDSVEAELAARMGGTTGKG